MEIRIYLKTCFLRYYNLVDLCNCVPLGKSNVGSLCRKGGNIENNHEVQVLPKNILWIYNRRWWDKITVLICAGKFYLNFIWTNYKIFHFLNCNLGLEVEIIINLRSIQYNFLPSLKFPKEQLSEVETAIVLNMSFWADCSVLSASTTVLFGLSTHYCYFQLSLFFPLSFCSIVCVLLCCKSCVFLV